MNDYQIRTALKHQFFSYDNSNRDYLMIEELGLCHGASRIDIALIDYKLRGYEIKGEKDNLERLPNQTIYYNAVFNEVTLVVDYKHAYEALKIVPVWWGVWFIENGGDGRIKFSIAREPRENPKPDKLVIARLLWKYEALQILEELGVARGVRSKGRQEIYGRLIENIEVDQLRQRVCKQLKTRVNWRSDARQSSYAY